MKFLRVTQRQIAKLPRLLHMEYTPGEIAAEIGVTVETIRRSWIPLGLHYRRDETGHIWIVGDELAQWINARRRRRPGPHMQNNEAYCLKCKRVVTVKFNGTRPANVYAEFVTGRCPHCGAQVNRARKKRQGYKWSTEKTTTQ